ncbi:MAG: ATP-binding protein [Bacteroidales bacterium]|nr:ATP-binding protein [Bacteroidales bacterium]
MYEEGMSNISDIIAETTIYEFKQRVERNKPKSGLRSISAFANEVGGTLFFGIDDKGKLTENQRETNISKLRKAGSVLRVGPLLKGGIGRSYTKRRLIRRFNCAYRRSILVYLDYNKKQDYEKSGIE